MQNGTKNNIDCVQFYECGYCTNNIRLLYKNEKSRKVNFPAKVLRIKHKIYGNILVDTGYSPRIYKNGFTSFAYNLLNKTTVTNDDTIVSLLKKDGISSDDISRIIISHLHPDHIGGVHDFPHTPLIMSKASKGLIEDLGNNKVRNKEHEKGDMSIFKNMIDDSVLDRTTIFDPVHPSPLEGFSGIDLFDDKSIWLIDLPGHMLGQLGVYLPQMNLFYVADATWGMAYIGKKMTRIAKGIQEDSDLCHETELRIKRLKGVKIISSHGGEVFDHEELCKDSVPLHD